MIDGGAKDGSARLFHCHTKEGTGPNAGGRSSRGLTYNIRNVTTSITPPGGSPGALAHLGTDSDELISDAGATLHNNQAGVAARVAAGTTTLYTRDTSGGLVAERVGTTTRYPLRDALGSTLALTDSSGAKITGSDADYDPYGALTNTPTVSSQIGYAGGYTPTAGGALRLVHYGKRYYDPALGRWTQQDVIDQPADLRQANRYLYVGSNPVNYVDPTGMISIGDLLKRAALPYCIAKATRDTYRELRDARLLGALAPGERRRADRIAGANLAGCAPVVGPYIQDVLNAIPGFAG